MIRYGEVTVKTVYTEKEVNFIVFSMQGYLFRLVPTSSGFEISKLDRSLENNVDEKLTFQIGELIENYFL